MTEAVRNRLAEDRRARQREAARAELALLCGRTALQIAADRALIESSNDIALRDSEW
jgi:hypothetical protein